MKTCLIMILIGLAFFSQLLIWQMNAYKVSEPPYATVKSDGNIAIRKYKNMIVAEVTVQGERYEAINPAFSCLQTTYLAAIRKNEDCNDRARNSDKRYLSKY